MSIAAVIPALARNKYSPEGDLLQFGGLSLLEWKYNQLRKVKGLDALYISSPDAIFADMAREWGVGFLQRSGPGLQLMVMETLKGVAEDQILWAHPTSPFLTSVIFQEVIRTFQNLDPQLYDCVVTALPKKEYVFFQGKPLNLPTEGHVERTLLSPLMQVTNGAILASKQVSLRYQRPFGVNPYFFEVDNLRALEIKDLQDMDMTLEFLAKYMRSTMLNIDTQDEL